MLKSIYILEGQVQGADHSSGSKAWLSCDRWFPCMDPNPLFVSPSSQVSCL